MNITNNSKNIFILKHFLGFLLLWPLKLTNRNRIATKSNLVLVFSAFRNDSAKFIAQICLAIQILVENRFRKICLRFCSQTVLFWITCFCSDLWSNKFHSEKLNSKNASSRNQYNFQFYQWWNFKEIFIHVLFVFVT